MGDLNVELLRLDAHGPTSYYLGEFTSAGYYPLISLPTRLTDNTATLIDNIWTNKVETKIGSGLVTVRVSDHLPIFAFVGGDRENGQVREQGRRRRLVNEGRIGRFAGRLEGWAFDEVRAMGIEANVAVFWNELWDIYDGAFPWVEDMRKRRDVEKPWLDDAEFKGLVEEKGSLYLRKLRGRLGEGEGQRLVRSVRR